MRVVAIIGICKNAGKTTVLNYLLQKNHEVSSLTSIGLDGENKDIVFKNKKPKIYVMENTIIATSTSSLIKSDITYEVLKQTTIKTALGYIVIVRATTAGYAELSGPTNINDLEVLINDLKKFNTKKLYIDGALSRKQFSSLGLVDEVEVVIGAAFNTNIIKTCDEARLWYNLYKIKTTTKVFDNCNTIQVDNKSYNYEIISEEILDQIITTNTKVIYINSVVTTKILKYIINKFKNKNLELIIENPNKLFITNADFILLSNSKIALYVSKQININNVYINPTANGYSYDRQEFHTRISEIFNTRAIDVEWLDE